MFMEGNDDMAKRKLNKPISIKKYIIAVIVVLAIIFIGLYVHKWQQVKEEEKYLVSYLISTNTISFEMNDLEEITSILSETPNKYFIYISYTKDKDVYNLEKKLKPIIDDYALQSSFYFLNITEIKKSIPDYKNKIAEQLNISKDELNDIPVILYFEDGNLVQKIHTEKEFETFLEDKDFRSL